MSLQNGISIATKGAKSGLDKIFQMVMYVFGGLLAILAIVEFGLRMKIYSDYYGARTIYGTALTKSIIQLWNSQRQIDFAFMVILFIIAIALVVRAIMAIVSAKGNESVSRVSFNVDSAKSLCPNAYNLGHSLPLGLRRSMAAPYHLRHGVHDCLY